MPQIIDKFMREFKRTAEKIGRSVVSQGKFEGFFERSSIFFSIIGKRLDNRISSSFRMKNARMEVIL